MEGGRGGREEEREGRVRGVAAVLEGGEGEAREVVVVVRAREDVRGLTQHTHRPNVMQTLQRLWKTLQVLTWMPRHCEEWRSRGDHATRWNASANGCCQRWRRAERQRRTKTCAWEAEVWVWTPRCLAFHSTSA